MDKKILAKKFNSFVLWVEKEKKRARLILIICHVIFYSMTIAWFVASIITGDFIVRFSITGVFLF